MKTELLLNDFQLFLSIIVSIMFIIIAIIFIKDRYYAESKKNKVKIPPNV